MNLINTRESQFELLRIVAIFMVLIHHSLAVADTFGYTGHYTLNEGITGVLLNSAVIIGVNLFVLITGWFGVSDKKIFRKILFLLIEVTCYSGIAYLIASLFVSIRPRACFFPLFSFLPLWLHYNLNPLCVQY